MADENRDSLQDLFRLIRGGDTTSQVHVNAGGVGVWIAVTLAVSVFAVSVVHTLHMNREAARADAERAEMRQEIKRLNDYLAAIYMQAPSLRPKDKEQ